MAEQSFKVAIVGAGVAGLEAALALRELAGERVETTIVAPTGEFIYRPMSVREPFARAGAAHFPLPPLLAKAGAQHIADSLRWLDPGTRTIHTADGRAVPYDAVLLALGARQYARFTHGLTLDPARVDEQLHGLIQDMEEGYVNSIAFIVPPGRYWPLPAYELALATAARAYGMDVKTKITLISSEPAPLAVFGAAASDEVAALLERTGVELLHGEVSQIQAGGQISLAGQARQLHADRIVTLPELLGPSVAGLPANALHGFIATDPHGRVREVERVFAAGDITDYPVKQGAIAAQQALCVAQELAGLAGAEAVTAPFEPVIHGVLLGPSAPLYLRARLVGGSPVSSEVSDKPLWEPADKIHAPYLSAALADAGQPGLSITTLTPV